MFIGNIMAMAKSSEQDPPADSEWKRCILFQCSG